MQVALVTCLYNTAEACVQRVCTADLSCRIIRIFSMDGVTKQPETSKYFLCTFKRCHYLPVQLKKKKICVNLCEKYVFKLLLEAKPGFFEHSTGRI